MFLKTWNKRKNTNKLSRIDGNKMGSARGESFKRNKVHSSSKSKSFKKSVWGGRKLTWTLD